MARAGFHRNPSKTTFAAGALVYATSVDSFASAFDFVDDIVTLVEPALDPAILNKVMRAVK